MTEAVRHALLGLQPPVLFQKWLCRMRRLISAGADTLILGILVLSAVLSIRTAMSVYPLNSYWIELLCDYSGGFVRRFLLGEILNNLPGIAPETAGIAVLAACYAFVTFSLYSETRRLRFPLCIRILVLLSPFGAAFYLMVPTAAEHFLLRDILIIAMVILAAKAVCLSRGKADVPQSFLLGDAAVCAAVTFGMLCHSGILFCTPPLLLMYLGISGYSRRAFIHAAVLGLIFLGEFLTVNLVFGELEPGKVLDILDKFKARYPAIPIEISPYSFLFLLFAVSSGGESHWVGMARQVIFSPERIRLVLAAAAVPCLIFLCRYIRSGSGLREYLRRHWLAIACSASAFSPVLMSVFSIDFFRWLVWSFILSSYFAMQMTDSTEELPSQRSYRAESGVAGWLMSGAALAAVIFYTPASPSDGQDGGSGMLGKSSLGSLVTALMMQTGHPEPGKEYLYLIANEQWNWSFDMRAAGVSVEDSVRIRHFGRQHTDSHDPEPLESNCAGEFLSMYVSGGRLYLRGWESMVRRSDDGRISFVKPAHGMGFLVERGGDKVFYPTMPLIMTLDMKGHDQKIPFAFDDYLLIGNEPPGSKIKIYPAFLNGKNQVFYCVSQGRAAVLPQETVHGSGHS